MGRLDGKVAIITGAARGIGGAVAERFAREGAKLVLADRLEGVLVAHAKSLEPVAGEILTKVIDVSDRAQIEDLVDSAVERFGKLDILVNNAGIGSFGRVADTDPELWRQVFAIDVDSIFYAVRCAMPHLIKTKGCIVSTASISGMGGDYGMSAYNAAKGAVINFTRALAVDHAADGVRVNSVSPGFILTPLTGMMRAGGREAYDEVIPMGRAGGPDEIAAAVAFLASSDASYITGHNLVVDGGLTAHTGAPNLFRYSNA
jgi:meso-butanediol dehydrogenase/(S,S)-butanediol dehydrogenase/diacetyl reductase